MNSVHEQCPNNDSKTVLSQKLVKCTVCTHTAQAARPGAHKRAQARARACRVAGCCGRVVAVAPGLVVGAGRRVAGAGGRVVAWPPDRVATQCLPQLPFLVTIHLGVLQIKNAAASPSYVTIHLLYRDTLTSLANLLSQSQYT